MNYSQIKLDSIIDFNPKRTIKKGTIASFVEMAAIPEGNRDINYTDKKEFKGSGSKFKNGDTLFARITPCLENGKTAKVNCLQNEEIAHGSTEFIVMAAKEPEYDEDFVYNLCRWPKFREFAISRMEGTSGRQRVDWKVLASSEWLLPQKEDRKHIGFILKQIDDKIANNNRINQTLESIAQAIFKSWFVDFETVQAKMQAKAEGADPQLAAMCAISGKTEEELQLLPADKKEELAKTADLFPDKLVESELGMIPEGWGVKNLESYFDVNPPRSLKKGTLAKFLDMKNMPTIGHLANGVIQKEVTSGIKFKNGDTLIARITPCLQNGKTAFVDFLTEDEIGWGSTEYIVLRSKESLSIYMSYLLSRYQPFRNHCIQSMTGSSGRQRANAQMIKEYLLCMPEDNRIHKCFNMLIENNFKQIRNLGTQNESLSQIRDSLLPKLINGEIKLEENA